MSGLYYWGGIGFLVAYLAAGAPFWWALVRAIAWPALVTYWFAWHYLPLVPR